MDALVGMKYHELKERVPEAEFDVSGLLLPEKQKIRPLDLSIILGNALDNALEACERLLQKQPKAAVFIRVSSMQKGNFFLMEVANSFDGQVFCVPGEEFPRTGKPDKAVHGIGMRNMKSTVLRYQGALDWTAEGNVFLLSVMLKDREPEEGVSV